MEGVELVLLDIEGTLCSLSFVKDILFPYAIKALPEVLAQEWDQPTFQPYRNAFPEEYRQDPDVLRAHVEDLTKRDVKIAYLKDLQGFLWEEGYRTGAYTTLLFSDVVPTLRRWKREGYALAIYSSGSVFAQKLLFGHVRVDGVEESRKRDRPGDEVEAESSEAASPPRKKVITSTGEPVEQSPAEKAGASIDEDDAHDSEMMSALNESILKERPQSARPTTEENTTTDRQDDHAPLAKTEDITDMFSAWFDTTNAGLKTVSSSYSKIGEQLKGANTLQHEPHEILFLSDNPREVDAALEAGMKSIILDRPGNAPLVDADRERLRVVESLDAIALR